MWFFLVPAGVQNNNRWQTCVCSGLGNQEEQHDSNQESVQHWFTLPLVISAVWKSLIGRNNWSRLHTHTHTHTYRQMSEVQLAFSILSFCWSSSKIYVFQEVGAPDLFYRNQKQMLTVYPGPTCLTKAGTKKKKKGVEITLILWRKEVQMVRRLGLFQVFWLGAFLTNLC